jgi:tRNA-specific 2-thiouridylase
LSRTLFPLGGMTKPEVREIARELKLVNAEKPESQEICFVPDGDYAGFVEAKAARIRLRPGRVVDDSGAELARHEGVHRFTIGQRRGLGVATGEPLYVRAINHKTGDVTISRRECLSAKGLVARQVNLVAPHIEQTFDADVRIRYRHHGIPSTVRILDEPGLAEVRFDGDGPAVSPGQACVFYRGDEVLGGGFIERPLEVKE